MNKDNNIVIFGGSGFIGSHLAIYFLENHLTDYVYLADLVPPRFSNLPKKLKDYFDEGKIEFLRVDVRKPIHHDQLPKQTGMIFNLAAVHREPGHHALEYFETNLPGAEHVCEWATQINCPYIVFTSSIAVYGTSNSGPKSETSLPSPLTPYGISKLVAEKMHEQWQIANPERKLLIVRPGVIYGTGEAGNITRMVKAIIGGYFVFSGNEGIVKSGGYVKDLVASIDWMIKKQKEENSPQLLFNFTLHPSANLGQYAQAIKEVAGVTRKIWNVPYDLLLLSSYGVAFVTKIFGIKQPIDPGRVRKLLRQNNIIPHELINSGFKYQYSLKESLQDWLQEHPEDWNRSR